MREFKTDDKVVITKAQEPFFSVGDVGRVTGARCTGGGYLVRFDAQGNERVYGRGLWQVGESAGSKMELYKPKTKKGIRIEVEDLGRELEILSIKALRKDQLPTEYIYGDGAVYTKRGSRSLWQNHRMGGELEMLIEGKVKKPIWKEILGQIHYAGNLLRRVNEKKKRTYTVVI